jgi:hypothetical protein
MMPKPDLSVVILVEDESPDFARYLEALHDQFHKRGILFEFLIIANGVERFLKSQLSSLPTGYMNIKAYAFPNRVSQAVCVRAALKESASDTLVMCGSYQQITAEAFGALLDAFDDQVDLICPWRHQRVDPAFNQLQSRLFNAAVSFVTGSRFRDLNCTTRILRREVLENVRIYGNLYRLLPIMAQERGYRVREVPCAHYQERGKTGFYRLSEYMGRIVDIGTLYFNTRFSRKPLRFFSAIGAGLISVGGLITGWVFFQRLFSKVSIGNSPELLIAIILMVAGVTTAGLGLLGEVIAFTHGRQRKEYTIEKII